MRTSDFHYDLPDEQIAQKPAEPRDSSRLLVYNRSAGKSDHRIFRDITEYFGEGDVLVINDTRVIPARLHGTKRGSKVSVEFLLLKRLSETRWEVIMRPGRKLRPGDVVDFSSGFSAQITSKGAEGICEVDFSWEGVFEELLEEHGETPLPPYITDHSAPRGRYQTVYARENGSAAAPTAGLHFTEELLRRLRKKGVEIVHVMLHVGLGTFRPVKEDTVEDHLMHEEEFEITPEAADALNRAKREGRRITAVGTTSVRAVESAWDGAKVLPMRSETSIFLYPGKAFNVIDSLITNFHLPESTLLMLVAAFVGDTEKTLSIYRDAVKDGYRFFSFGDAMLIL